MSQKENKEYSHKILSLQKEEWKSFDMTVKQIVFFFLIHGQLYLEGV